MACGELCPDDLLAQEGRRVNVCLVAAFCPESLSGSEPLP